MAGRENTSAVCAASFLIGAVENEKTLLFLNTLLPNSKPRKFIVANKFQFNEANGRFYLVTEKIPEAEIQLYMNYKVNFHLKPGFNLPWQREIIIESFEELTQT